MEETNQPSDSNNQLTPDAPQDNLRKSPQRSIEEKVRSPQREEEDMSNQIVQPEQSIPPQFRSSSLPQPPELTQYLQELVQSEPYNKFCVDCHHNYSTYACITYGTFICEECANIHKLTFGGRQTCQIKEVFNELWDDYQLAAVWSGNGGNKNFFSFLQEYSIHQLPIETKYKHLAVQYYAKRLSAKIDDKSFNDQPPAKNIEEKLIRAKSTVETWIKKGERTISFYGEKIDRDIEKRGWRNKVSDFFKTKFAKKDGQNSRKGSMMILSPDFDGLMDPEQVQRSLERKTELEREEAKNLELDGENSQEKKKEESAEKKNEEAEDEVLETPKIGNDKSEIEQ